jgi:hypothetical protein
MPSPQPKNLPPSPKTTASLRDTDVRVRMRPNVQATVKEKPIHKVLGPRPRRGGRDHVIRLNQSGGEKGGTRWEASNALGSYGMANMRLALKLEFTNPK